MKIEYEVRVLDVDFDVVIRKLEAIGAVRVGVYHQKRYVYDFIPAEKGRWIRLRSNGAETTLTIKEIKSLRIDGTKELEIVVSDFEDTNEMLKKLGYVPRTFQENFRIEYTLNGINFDLDKWPMIPSYLEIEGKSELAVTEAINSLGWSIDMTTTQDVDSIYSKIYGIDLDTIKTLKFDDAESELINSYK